jgi:hypothetical protein
MTEKITGVYAVDHNVSVDSIEKELSGSNPLINIRELASEVLEICEAGYNFGLQGMYPDGEFGSDADFVYGTGDKIRELEFRLENAGFCTDDGPVFEMFREAHSHGLNVYESDDEPVSGETHDIEDLIPSGW